MIHHSMLVQARHRGYSFARTTAAVGWKAESTLDTPEGVMAQEVRYLRIIALWEFRKVLA